MKNIAKLTSYGCYLDCDFVTAKYPEDETHIVGNVAEYVYDLEQKISELEAKLAEMTEKYNACQEARKLEIEFNKQDKAELKQQLEEYKQSLKKTIDHYEKYCSEIHHQNIMLYAAACNAQQSNQNKISFTVEQLEKVKELLLENLYDLYSKPSEIWDKYGDLYDVVVEGAVNGTIDNQIKQLKEGK